MRGGRGWRGWRRFVQVQAVEGGIRGRRRWRRDRAGGRERGRGRRGRGRGRGRGRRGLSHPRRRRRSRRRRRRRPRSRGALSAVVYSSGRASRLDCRGEIPRAPLSVLLPGLQVGVEGTEVRERLEKSTRGYERLHLPGAHLPGAVRAVRASVDAQGKLATDAEVRHGVDEARPRLGRLELLHQLHERALRASLRGRGHAELDRVHPACGGERRGGTRRERQRRQRLGGARRPGEGDETSAWP